MQNNNQFLRQKTASQQHCMHYKNDNRIFLYYLNAFVDGLFSHSESNRTLTWPQKAMN